MMQFWEDPNDAQIPLPFLGKVQTYARYKQQKHGNSLSDIF